MYFAGEWVQEEHRRDGSWHASSPPSLMAFSPVGMLHGFEELLLLARDQLPRFIALPEVHSVEVSASSKLVDIAASRVDVAASRKGGVNRHRAHVLLAQ